jgi:hypothetical protein
VISEIGGSGSHIEGTLASQKIDLDEEEAENRVSLDLAWSCGSIAGKWKVVGNMIHHMVDQDERAFLDAGYQVERQL